MNDDMAIIAKERLELALQALEMRDLDRCGRLALSVAEMTINAKSTIPRCPSTRAVDGVPPEIADWPVFSNPEAWGHISESIHG